MKLLSIALVLAGCSAAAPPASPAPVSPPAVVPALRPLPLARLAGPFASIEAYCAGRQKDEEDQFVSCGPSAGQGDAVVVTEVEHGDRRSAVLAVRGGEGWWIDAGDDYPALSDVGRGRGGYLVTDLQVAGGVVIFRGVQASWHKPLVDADAPGMPDHDLDTCFGLETLCRLGDAPRCSEALPIAGKADCGLGSFVDPPPTVSGWSWTDWRTWDWALAVAIEGDVVAITGMPKLEPDSPQFSRSVGEQATIALARTLPGRYRFAAPTK